ncbi:MAG: Crp/Fnr family transcriptional regulator [Firmicutes bacterium]|nr:Crp/Fnr family transcriptional regulator [Bacillota bacterium]
MITKKIQFMDNISQESVDKMIPCFKPTFKNYKQGETILSYSDKQEQVCILLEGTAKLYFSDIEGDFGLLENYEAGDLFGDVFSLPLSGYEYTVTATSDCRVVFISYHHIIHPCCNACPHHSQLISNLFLMTTQKSQELSLHINILSQNTTRKKLLTYFQFVQAGCNAQIGQKFEIPMSLGSLSEYLCVERTAMMRELRQMKNDGILEGSRRTYKMLKSNLA